MLTGSNAGLERVISSNTSTQITVSYAFPNSIIAGDTYEIVLLFKDGDHFVANTTLGTNIISEYEDNGTFYVDGLYVINLASTATSVVRGIKTINTMIEFTFNNPSTQGTYGAWSYIDLSAAANSNNINIQFWKISHSVNGILTRSGSPQSDGSNIRYIWANFTSTSCYYNLGLTLDKNATYSNLLFTASRGSRVTLSGNTSTFIATAEKIWSEDTLNGGVTFGTNSNIIVRDCVFNGTSNMQINLASGFTRRIQDCYISTVGGDSIVLGPATASGSSGSFIASRNIITMGRFAYGPSGTGTSTIETRFNDFVPKMYTAFRAIDYESATTFSSAKSDNDYISGTNNATPSNVDTTANTTSTATPPQYRNLTSARTNPKNVRNRPLEIDNVVIGTITSSSATITFDCKNGAVVGHGSTTVNADSGAGTSILDVADTNGFEVGEIIEIGFGTARFEEARVAFIGGSSLTLETNLVYTHTAAQSDTVKKQLRIKALPFIRFGTVSGVYDHQSTLPDKKDWGLIWTEIKDTFNGIQYAWKHYGHSVTLSNLKPSTTYYFKCYAYSPISDLLEAVSEGTFTTTSSTNFTDPGEDNVRLGISYQFDSAVPNKTGNLRVPSVDDVRLGIDFDSNDYLTGTVRLPDPSDVLLGVEYDANDSVTGTLDFPTAAQIAGAVWDEPVASHQTSGSFGKLVFKILTFIKILLTK